MIVALRRSALAAILLVTACGSGTRAPDARPREGSAAGSSTASSAASSSAASSAAPDASATAAGAPVRAGELPTVTGVLDVFTEGERGCVVLASRRAACWGTTPLGVFGSPTALEGAEDLDSVAFTAQGMYLVHTSGAVDLLRRGDGMGSLDKPAQIVHLPSLSDVVKIETGETQNCALHRDGRIDCFGLWGNPTPEPLRFAEAARDLAVGNHHVCLVTKGGQVACWGSGSRGELGLGTKEHAGNGAEIVRVDGIDDAVRVVAGAEHTCALRKNGEVVCWGEREGARRDEPGAPPPGTPWRVPIAGAVDLRANGAVTCALHAGGAASCWGYNGEGSLGDGTREGVSEPVRVRGLEHIARIAPGSMTCAATSDGRLACWGHVVHATPVAVKGLDKPLQISAGTSHTCAVRADGEVVCWGERDEVKASIVTHHDALEPAPIGISKATFVVAGAPSSRIHDGCAVSEGGKVTCFSEDGFSKPGIDDASTVALGQGHGCALRKSGAVACWGMNDRGQLASPGAEHRTTATDVPGLRDVTAIAAGGDSTCALSKSGSVVCWGSNAEGELGRGDTGRSGPPAKVSGLDDAVQISMGFRHACARRRSGRVSCWGSNLFGIVTSATEDLVVSRPKDTPITDAVDVSASTQATCVVRASGRVSCRGELDDTTSGGAVATADRRPLDVVGLTDAVRVAQGDKHACALLKRGGVSCWGDGGRGELGDGSGPGVPAFVTLPAR